MTPGTPVYVRSTLGRHGLATYVRQRRDGRHVVQFADDAWQHVCHLTDDVRPEERAAAAPGELVAVPLVERVGGRAVPKGPADRRPSYLAWIRSQPCAWTLDGVTPREASHHPEPGHGSTGAKTSDLRTLPLRPDVHRRYHETGAVGDMTPERSRAWVEAQIAEHLTRYAREQLGLTSLDAERARTRALRALLVDELERQQRRAK